MSTLPRLISISFVAAALLIDAAYGQETFRQSLSADEQSAVVAKVKARLRDPSSAEFRWLPRTSTDGSYCGLVNARNGFGGLTGFVPFLAFVETVRKKDGDPYIIADLMEIGDGDPRSSTSVLVAQMCAKSGYNLSGD